MLDRAFDRRIDQAYALQTVLTQNGASTSHTQYSLCSPRASSSTYYSLCSPRACPSPIYSPQTVFDQMRKPAAQLCTKAVSTPPATMPLLSAASRRTKSASSGRRCDTPTKAPAWHFVSKSSNFFTKLCKSVFKCSAF